MLAVEIAYIVPGFQTCGMIRGSIYILVGGSGYAYTCIYSARVSDMWHDQDKVKVSVEIGEGGLC